MGVLANFKIGVTLWKWSITLLLAEFKRPFKDDKPFKDTASKTKQQAERYLTFSVLGVRIYPNVAKYLGSKGISAEAKHQMSKKLQQSVMSGIGKFLFPNPPDQDRIGVCQVNAGGSDYNLSLEKSFSVTFFDITFR